jgi:ribosomal protein S1
MPSTNQSKKPQTMAELLASVKTNFVKVNKGEIIEGTLTKLTPSEMLVDIGAKTEALVLEKDKKIQRSLMSSLKVGDKVTVSVLNPESDMGNPVVSLRRFNDNRVWEKLEELIKNKNQLDVIVEESTKGGFLVSTRDGISGFLPNSQAVFLENSQALLGREIKVSVIELNRPLRKIILSQKAGLSSEGFDKASRILKRGQKVTATISNVAPFGIFSTIDFGENISVEGFIHISEISWEKIATVPDNFVQGEKIEAEVLGLDRDSKRVNLSIKNLIKNPFEEKLNSYKTDQKVKGTVSKVLSSGVLIDIERGIEGFIKKDKIPPTLDLKEGATVNATVVEIDSKKHRVILVPVLTEKPIGYR